MKVYAYPTDITGCGCYRLIWVSEILKNQGHDIELRLPGHRGFNAVIDNNTNKVIDLSLPKDADVIVLQRPTHKYLAQAIPLIRARGIAVVIDMDDDLSTVHPSNPAWTYMHPRSNTDHSWNSAADACRDATYVTVSSHQLMARYAGHGRGRVLNNYVPERYLKIEHTDSRLIGWGGSVHSHPDDPPALGPTIQRLIDDDHRFKVIGHGMGIKQAFNLLEEPHVSGTVGIEQWPEALTKLGIGIAPLADTIFNASKSWLKPLEYAAVGVPCVMSPRAEYTRISRKGIGITARRPKDWYTQLLELVRDDAKRQDLSASGREVVATQLTIERNAWRWWEAWEEALRIQRGNNL